MIFQLNRIQLDRDSAFPFKIHLIQQLLFHIPFLDGFRQFQDAVRKRGLSMVNMGNNAEITNMILINSVHQSNTFPTS